MEDLFGFVIAEFEKKSTLDPSEFEAHFLECPLLVTVALPRNISQLALNPEPMKGPVGSKVEDSSLGLSKAVILGTAKPYQVRHPLIRTSGKRQSRTYVLEDRCPANEDPMVWVPMRPGPRVQDFQGLGFGDKVLGVWSLWFGVQDSVFLSMPPRLCISNPKPLNP